MRLSPFVSQGGIAMNSNQHICVTQLTTPYGTTRFARSTSGTGASTIRGLDITDALGHKSRLIGPIYAIPFPGTDIHFDWDAHYPRLGAMIDATDATPPTTIKRRACPVRCACKRQHATPGAPGGRFGPPQ
jgi:hypothetical protein